MSVASEDANGASAREAAYIAGSRMAWTIILGHALRELGHEESHEVAAARLAIELEETRAALRSVCAAYGDNDWDESLNLADVVEKHLGRPLDAELGRR